MKVPFERYKSGECTLENFREMCLAHDLTYNFSDDHQAWKNGEEEYRLIGEAAIKLGKNEVRQIWNDAVLSKLLPFYAENYLW